MKKYLKKTNLNIGGTILGTGNDGYVVDSISCKPTFSKEQGYVAKVFNKKIEFNRELHNKLKELDPESKRFAYYHFPSDYSCNIQIDSKNDNDNKNIVFIKLLNPLPDMKNMTKIQYRYLRDSLDILKKNKIMHGDLPGNVLLDPITDLPIIIDWDHSILNAASEYLLIDTSGFMNYSAKRIIKN